MLDPGAGRVEGLGHVEHRLLGLGGQTLGHHPGGIGADLAGEVHDRAAPGRGGVVVPERRVGAGDVVEGDGHAVSLPHDP